VIPILILALQATASLQGVVRDSPGAALHLKHANETRTAIADNQGRYRFAELAPGDYIIVETGATVTLNPGESRTLDLTLKPSFFDPPAFVVAGVTDSSNRGGHGSDPVLHSTEALSKAAAALGPADEKRAPLEAVKAAQQVAERNPTEPTVFAWGAELLTHRAAEQAAEVFTRGHAAYPRSTRLLLGLAVACYSQADYDKARQYLFEATDLNPTDPTPYLFLGQTRTSPVAQSPGFEERMNRFAKLHPENPWANYYAARFDEAVRLNPHFEEAWLQLGNVRAEKGQTSPAIEAWQHAPSQPEAHYRLARAYRQIGDAGKAKVELELFDKLSKQSDEAEAAERASIQEFVFTLKDKPQ
jgi:tetratricopeptide (TPR) repeat protein